MANIKIIKRRIKSAGNISQITRAMEMVAASKMKKAQDTALSGKPYADKIYTAVTELARKTNIKSHQLLSPGNQSAPKLVIIISSNKGLCGGLNTNLFRYLGTLGETEKADFITLGKKGENFVVRTSRNLIADFSAETPFSKSVVAVTKLMVEGFTGGQYSQVRVVYNNFVSALKQVPISKVILPISAFENKGIVDNAHEEPAVAASQPFGEFTIEPSVENVLESLLPHYLENQIRTAIFESEASEHSARMIAMKNATDAADDLITDLNLVYNKARQEKITYEIADMVTARMAVE